MTDPMRNLVSSANNSVLGGSGPQLSRIVNTRGLGIRNTCSEPSTALEDVYYQARYGVKPAALTVFASFTTLTNIPISRAVIDIGGNAHSTHWLLLYTEAVGRLGWWLNGVGRLGEQTTSANTYYQQVFTLSGSTWTAYLNGVQVGTGTQAPGTNNSDYIVMMSGYAYSLPADYELFHIVDRAYGPAEVKGMWENPWQIFKPRKRVRYFDAPSFPTLSSLTAGYITSSGGRLTAN